MRRKYERKTRPVSALIEESFSDYLNQLANVHGRPKNTFPPASGPYLQDSSINLHMWLRQFARDEKSLEYSALLQFWLHAHGMPWPKGVFKSDLTSAGSGRKNSDLALRAYFMYRPHTVGFGKVAKWLMPREYKRDPEAAKKKIRDIIRNVENKQTPLVKLLELGYKLLGIPFDADEMF